MSRISRRKHRHPEQRPDGPAWRVKLHDIIFEADTLAGRTFDIVLLVVILFSIAVIALETVPSYAASEFAMRWLRRAEWACALFFAVEYVLRLSCSRRPLKYAFSFWGVIDLLSFLPSILTGFEADPQRSFVILRSVRLLRVFRVLKLWRMINEADDLSRAVWNARGKIVVFLAVVLVAVTISGTLMYHIEHRELENGEKSQFTSIPQSMYWAIVTMTTVGYGDIVPKTTIGKVLSGMLILLGYSLIIVPSGFVSSELVSRNLPVGNETEPPQTVACPRCAKPTHATAANYCDRCGERLASQLR